MAGKKDFEKIPLSLAEQVRIPGQGRVPYIVGGIGPASQIPFLEHLLRFRSEARGDQEHIGYVLVNETPFPDRTEALLVRETDPRQYEEIGVRIINAARKARMESCGFIIFICNTIHAWRDELQPLLLLPWVPIMGSVAQELVENYREGTSVGVLSTTGTLKMRLYDKALEKVGLVPVTLPLDSEMQQSVMDAIYHKDYGIKATGVTVSDRAVQTLTAAADWLVDNYNTKVIIGGCTEIPLALNAQTYRRVSIVDPLESLARLTLKLALDPNASFPK